MCKHVHLSIVLLPPTSRYRYSCTGARHERKSSIFGLSTMLPLHAPSFAARVTVLLACTLALYAASPFLATAITATPPSIVIPTSEIAPGVFMPRLNFGSAPR